VESRLWPREKSTCGVVGLLPIKF